MAGPIHSRVTAGSCRPLGSSLVCGAAVSSTGRSPWAGGRKRWGLVASAAAAGAVGAGVDGLGLLSPATAGPEPDSAGAVRSEERRVGKEGRSWVSAYQYK